MPPKSPAKRSPPNTKAKGQPAKPIAKDGSRGTISAAFQRAKANLDVETREKSNAVKVESSA
eukprot:125517-Prymnesium_polylepis.1